jgi:hypothetical protein
MIQKIEIFCCYAREDQNLLDKLKRFLVPLQRQDLISNIWSDTEINPGTDWEKEIHKHLDSAQVILLLVSPDFLASDYCNSVELKQAMDRYEKGQAHVIPIILRPTHLRGALFEKLQMLPTERRPVTKWENQDDAFLDIVQGVERVIEEVMKAAEERKSLRKQQVRVISLFGYETGGGTRSALWTDPITPELDDKKFQEWRDSKRAFRKEEVVGHTWIKIASNGNIFIVRFLEKEVLEERSLSDPGKQWDGSWRLIDGVLRVNIRPYELDVFANQPPMRGAYPENSMHSGLEFKLDQTTPHAYFALLPWHENKAKHWPLDEVPTLVERIFEQILERSANQRELIAYGSLLHRGEMSVRDIIKILGLSQEHRKRFFDTGTVGEVLELCYKHFLGRVIDSTGRTFYPEDVEIKGFSWLVNDIIDSDEYVNEKFGEDTVPPDAITCLTATSMYPNHLEYFYRGSDSHLWHRWWYGEKWSGEDNRGGILTSAPATISRDSRWIDCFYRGANNHLWHRQRDSKTNHWNDEEDWGVVLTSAPTVASWGPDRLDCFYRGQDNCLWHHWWDGKRHKEENLGGTLTSAPAAVSWYSRWIDCFYRGANNHLWHRWGDGKDWSDEEDLGGFLTSAPTVTSWEPNRLDCFVRGRDYHLWQLTWEQSESRSIWHKWVDLGGSLASAPTAVSWGPNRIYCLYLSRNNSLCRHWWEDDHWNQEDLGFILS